MTGRTRAQNRVLQRSAPRLWTWAHQISKEAWRSARGTPVGTGVTVFLVLAMCVGVLLTSGRTVANEQQVLSQIDSYASRTITVRAQPGANLSPTVVDRVAQFAQVAWVGGFTAATDVSNQNLPPAHTPSSGVTRVALRHMWTPDLSVFAPSPQATLATPVVPDSVWASPEALTKLAMPFATGSVVSGLSAGLQSYPLVQQIATPEHLAFLEPLLIIPTDVITPESQIGVLVVVAHNPNQVDSVALAVRSVLNVADPLLISVETSSEFNHLREIVAQELGGFGRSMVLLVFAGCAVLVGAVLYGMVMMKRKDYGRRRALGASQSLVVSLVLVQTGLLAIIGAVSGSALSLAVLAFMGDPLPKLPYVLSVATLAVITALIAAVIPAIAAARRDPLTELRVP